LQEKTIIYELCGSVAIITLNRPKSLNSLNDALVSDLIAALKEADLQPHVKSIIITGGGRAFSAGGDLAFLGALDNAKKAHEFIEKVGSIVTLIQSIPKPVIAMVNGVAAGAGFNLALACDIIFCADTAKFAQSFAKAGLVPDCGGMYLLPRAVGLHKAKELMFTADLISAEEAYRLGFINCLTSSDELYDKTLAFAKRLENSAPLALKLIKQTLNGSDSLTLPNLLTAEATLQTLCMQTSDHKEGVAAFLEKRPPKFSGC
jgi:2-(1,2-epoxy-1,2-dihydrophenyl)acetyl-CoA isomerase